MSTQQVRELQLARREGFVAGVEKVARMASGWGGNASGQLLRIAGQTPEEAAADKYPLPKVAVPRVETDRDGDCWKFDGSTLLMQRGGREGWYTPSVHDIRHSSREAIAKVLASPDVLVDDPRPSGHLLNCAKLAGLGSDRDAIDCTCQAGVR